MVTLAAGLRVRAVHSENTAEAVKALGVYASLGLQILDARLRVLDDLLGVLSGLCYEEGEQDISAGVENSIFFLQSLIDDGGLLRHGFPEGVVLLVGEYDASQRDIVRDRREMPADNDTGLLQVLKFLFRVVAEGEGRDDHKGGNAAEVGEKALLFDEEGFAFFETKNVRFHFMLREELRADGPGIHILKRFGAGNITLGAHEIAAMQLQCLIHKISGKAPILINPYYKKKYLLSIILT